MHHTPESSPSMAREPFDSALSKSKVYTFDIHQLEQCRPLWEAITALSVPPRIFDHSQFLDHVNQPYLKDISDSLEYPPTEAMIRVERDVPLLELRNSSYPPPTFPYLTSSCGIVHLKKFMKDDTDWDFLNPYVEDIFKSPVKARGHFLYPPHGFKEWHTNIQSAAGWRMYIINVDRNGESFFRYVDPVTGTLETVWDFDGAVNIFHIGSEPLLWHCVKSLNAYRWSRGFLIPDNWPDVLKVTL